MHCLLQQPVAPAVPVGVVERFEADDVDVGDGEQACRPAGAIDLVVEVRQAGRARARPGQRVGLSDRELFDQRVAVCLCLQPVASSLIAVCRGSRSTPSGFGSGGRRGLAVLRGARFEIRRRRDLLSGFGVTQCLFAIAKRRDLIACRRGFIAIGGSLDTPLGDMPALLRIAIARSPVTSRATESPPSTLSPSPAWSLSDAVRSASAKVASRSAGV
jgi:hypothetical protein